MGEDEEAQSSESSPDEPKFGLGAGLLVALVVGAMAGLLYLVFGGAGEDDGAAERQSGAAKGSELTRDQFAIIAADDDNEKKKRQAERLKEQERQRRERREREEKLLREEQRDLRDSRAGTGGPGR